MVTIKVGKNDELFAKNQIKEFEKTDSGRWRYTGVEAWRGIVCEMLTSKWLCKNFSVSVPAKGLDTSGIVDDFDIIVNGKKVEIKSATKNYFKYLMPKIYDIIDKPKDIYIGVKFNETVKPNVIHIIGFIELEKIKTYPVKQNKGAKYYEVPLSSLKPINKDTFK